MVVRNGEGYFVVGLERKPEQMYIAKRVGLGLDEVAIPAGKE